MTSNEILSDLRGQKFYRGQILHVKSLPGRAPSAASASDPMMARFPRLQNGSLPSLLAAMGYDSIYTNLISALGTAFGADGDSDALLVADYSAPRELFWQLAAILEAVDEGRICMVLCRNQAAAIRAERRLRVVIDRADIGYACNVLRLKRDTAAATVAHDFPLIQIYTPETLRLLLQGGFGHDFADMVLPATRRLIIPNLTAWNVQGASHVAWLLRELHVEAARTGVSLSLLATASVTSHLRESVEAIWSKPLRPNAWIESDSVEYPPATFAFYGGALVRDPASGEARWIRQDLATEAGELLKWLVGPVVGMQFRGSELHYVVDVSGSMLELVDSSQKGVFDTLLKDLAKRLLVFSRKEIRGDDRLKKLAKRVRAGTPCRLDVVMSAILQDFERRSDAGKLDLVRRVKLTAFNIEARERFSWSGEKEAFAALPELTRAVLTLELGGCTDLPKGLWMAMGSALREESASVELVLFSDGGSEIDQEDRHQLLTMVRKARSVGRQIGLTYVIMDMSPPKAICNLILELGGRIVAATSENLISITDLGPVEEKEEVVVYYSAEGGLPESVGNSARTGSRKLECIHHLSDLQADPKQVVAIVVSGGFSGFDDLASRVRYLGKFDLMVFVLSEADARAQLLIRDHRPEGKQLRPTLLASAENPFLAYTRLLDHTRGQRIEAVVARYLLEGSDFFGELEKAFRSSLAKIQAPLDANAISLLPQGFVCDTSDGESWVLPQRGQDALEGVEFEVFTGFTGGRHVRLRGGMESLWDAPVASLLLLPGCRITSEDGNFAVREFDEVKAEALMDPASVAMTQPILSNVSVVPDFPDVFLAATRRLSSIGDLSHGNVRLNASVMGIKTSKTGNLDDGGSLREELFNQPKRVEFQTAALKWTPKGVSADVIPGLVSLLNITLPSIFRNLPETLLVLPDLSDVQPSIWMLDLAPGGNGASALLIAHAELLEHVLRLGGLIALDCPCEEGFSGVSAGAPVAHADAQTDSGCPRCTRAFGPVLRKPDGTSMAVAGSKKGTLEWMLGAGLLPQTGASHIQEKYAGTVDLQRVSGPDQGTRRGALPLCRKILEDRLGLFLNDEDIASCDWLNQEDPTTLGIYDPNENRLHVRKDLREWHMLDVTAHEFFHNLQHRYCLLGGKRR